MIACRLRTGTAIVLLGIVGISVADVERDELSLYRLNQLQYIVTHNAYHIAPVADIDEFVRANGLALPSGWGPEELMDALAYTRQPISIQLARGIRGFELDVYFDPYGGQFAKPGLMQSVGTPIEQWHVPGFKTFHTPDYDQRTTCIRFIACLQMIHDWSSQNAAHLPIVVMVEAKEKAHEPIVATYQSTPVLTFQNNAWHELEEDIRLVFDSDELVLPESIRGSHVKMSDALAVNGWPQVDALRGKVLFILMAASATTADYREYAMVAEEPTLFTSFWTTGVMETDEYEGDHALILFPTPSTAGLSEAVRRGLLVSVRSDANTKEARSNTTARRDAALGTGAMLIKTDFPVPDTAFSDYRVQFNDDTYVRCNPLTAVTTCQPPPLWLNKDNN